MILTVTAPDNITLDLAKAHCYISITDDDLIVAQYIEASRGVVEDYIHASVLQKTFTSEPHELLTVDDEFILRLDETPNHVFVLFDGQTAQQEIPKSGYYYKNNYLHIPLIPGSPNVHQFTVNTGKVKQSAQIMQARLLLIGTYYTFKENTVALRLNEVPDGVKRILGNSTEASL